MGYWIWNDGTILYPNSFWWSIDINSSYPLYNNAAMYRSKLYDLNSTELMHFICEIEELDKKTVTFTRNYKTKTKKLMDLKGKTESFYYNKGNKILKIVPLVIH